jgi:hypothetical protein
MPTSDTAFVGSHPATSMRKFLLSSGPKAKGGPRDFAIEWTLRAEPVLSEAEGGHPCRPARSGLPKLPASGILNMLSRAHS